jgi:hypothetical protein
MKPEYSVGHKIREEFERTMTALFRAPKPKDRKQPKKKATERKSEKTDKD